MPSVKELVEQMRSKLGDEVESKVDSDLVAIVAEGNRQSNSINEQKQDIANVNRESKDRKEKIRTLEPQVVDLTGTIEELNVKLNDNSHVAELERLKAFEKTTYEGQRGTFISFIEKVKEEPRFEKAKSRFKIPSENGKMQLEKIKDQPIEDLQQNIKQMNELVDLGYFETVETNVNVDITKGTGFRIEGVPTLQECQEAKLKLGSSHPKYIEMYKKLREARPT